MSTRCMINFRDEYGLEAKIYRHSDGYPDSDAGVLADLQRFFEAVKDQCEGTMIGTRFDDPCYLSAKFVVWQAFESYRHDPEAPLNFGSLGISQENHGDEEYEYEVWCETKYCDPTTGFPAVTYHKPGAPPVSPDKPDVEGYYRVRVSAPASGHPFEGVTEFVWYGNHPVHIRNKASKRNLFIESMEFIGADEPATYSPL